MRKPRRNDTRAGANWALEVTPSRGMLFHPRSMPRPTFTAFLPAPGLAISFYLFILFLVLYALRIDAADEDFEN